jgi:hypothetical protein
LADTQVKESESLWGRINWYPNIYTASEHSLYHGFTACPLCLAVFEVGSIVVDRGHAAGLSSTKALCLIHLHLHFGHLADAFIQNELQ